MSTFGGFSGFSQSSNQNTGGFGTTNTNPSNTGFGAGFGTSSTTTNPFGGGTGTGGTGTGGFGSGGGFGQSTGGTSLFGQSKPAFGATASTGAGMFGNTATAGSGGFGGGSGTFGGTTANNNPFGGSSTGNFSFGQSKPAFGGGSGAGLFGTSSSTTGTTGFGTTQNNLFGQAGAGTALGPGVPPSEGTISTPFNPTNEKDPSGPGMNNFQSINVMPAYSKYSFEELRAADYDKGRRFGNGSGQPGAFGGTTGFGTGGGTFGGQSTTGFGGAGGNNLFGGTSTSGTSFGQTTSTPFGGGGGGGLFGTAKPQTGGLLGTQSSSAPSGGLFGTTQNTGTSFGGTGTTFGQAASNTNPFGTSQTQAKPSLFGTTGGGLGGTGSTGGGLFGGIGTNQPTQSSNTFGGFGTQNQQGQQTQEQNKPGGLFGGFGPTQSSQPQPASGLFGATQPATGGGGLFGTGTSGQGTTGFGGAGQNTGGGLFGNTSTQQQQQQQQQKPSLFGGAGAFGGTQTQGTGSLFGGGTNTSQQGSSLFGGASNNTGGLFNTSQQQKPNPFGTTPQNPSTQNNGLFGGQSTNSLFNTSQQNQQTPQQPQALQSSLLDGNPYGQSSIWSGLPEATPQNSGPLVTPLSASQRLKESQMKAIPSFRLSSPKLMTPPRRQGYGFTYSTYGSPNSAASTPGGGGLSSSMYGRSFTGGSFGRSVGKSFSASNLRQQFATDGESVLSPGAFAPGSSRYSSGSIRRLTIDRNLKTDLFSRSAPSQPAISAPSNTANVVTKGDTNGETPNNTTLPEQPSKLKKRVSFDKDTTGGTQDGSLNGVNGALVRTETDGPEPSAEEQGFLRSSRRGKSMNGTSSAPPQMEQVRGKELAVVPEDRETDSVISKMRLPTDAPAVVDPKPGEYWTKPSRSELSKMSREKLQHFKGLQVGRQGCGFVTFDEEVDLTTIPLDDLFGKIIEIRIRSITVYPDASTKPPPGKGLNVSSTLHLENSWPRARGAPSSATSGPLFERHILRLKRMPNTQYVSYDTQTGVWTFKVAHYTRYGLDYDDEDESGDDSNESALSDPPDHLVEPQQTPRAENTTDSRMDVDDDTPEESSPDDTFDFKRKNVPGGFGRQSAVDYDQEDSLDDHTAAAVSGSEKAHESEQEGSDDEMNMAGSFPQPDNSTQPEESPAKSAMKLSRHPWDIPGKPLIDLDGDWAEQLQRTISPRKQNREALRDIQGRVLLDRVGQPTKQQTVSKENEIRTNIDLMNSLFGQHEERMALNRRKSEGEHGIEDYGVSGSDVEPTHYPYPKRAKTFDADGGITGADKKWHESFPLKWTPTGSLLYTHDGPTPPQRELAWTWRDTRLNVSKKRDVVESSLLGDGRTSYSNSEWGWHNAKITIADGVPFAKQKPMKFSAFCEQIRERDRHQGQTAESKSELDIYELAHVLFDKYDDKFSRGLNPSQRSKYAERIRKDRLSEFWAALIQERHTEQLRNASNEEHAIVLLSAHQIHDACYRLTELGSPRLSTMIAQLDTADDQFHSDMEEQLRAWRDQNIISEISEPIRALYELLAGNTTISEGKSQGPLENRASTFSISERFDLDWTQAFGLCLWYGKAKNGNIEDIVRDFAEKSATKQETATPYPDGLYEGEQQHPLWVLLQLYSATKGSPEDAPALPQSLAPLSRPFDNRITFQLHHALTSNIPALPVNTELADKLAIDLTFQHSASSFHLGAVFALMHISDPQIREHHIRDLLIRHDASLPQMLDHKAAQIDKQWQTLVERLKVPTAWLCRAKAIYHRSIHQSLYELRYLLLGESWVEAHDCLVKRVAPRAVIEEDWDVIRVMVEKFGKEIKKHVPDWSTGAGMYEDFVSLIVIENGRKKGESDEETKQEREASLKRLQAALGEVGKGFKKKGGHLAAGGLEELEQRVACQEMARKVADVVAREQKSNHVLELPLTADARLRHAKEMALRHYRAVMAAH